MTDSVADVVRVVFEATGQNELSRVFESIESRMGRFEKTTAATTQAGATARVKAVVNERKEREAAYAAMFKEIEKKEKEATKSADKAARDKAKSEANAARERLRAEEDLAKSQIRIRENSARMAGRLAEEQATAEIRAAKRSLDEQERLAKRRTADAKRWSSSVTGTLGGSVSRVLGGVGMLAGSALAIGGGAGFADSIRGELGAEKAATQLANAMYVPGVSARGDKEELLKQAKLIEIESHIGKAESLAAAQSYIDLASDPKLFEKNKKTGRTGFQELSKIAKAEGANVGEVFAAAGDLRVQNESLTQEGVLDMVRGMVGAGKKGAISMREMAAVAGKVTATSVAYQGDQTTSQNRLLGLAQLARRVTTSDEVGTVVSRFTSDVLAHQKTLSSKYGIEVADKQGRLDAPSEILSKMIGKSGGNLQKLHEMGLGIEGIRMAEAALTLGNDPEKVKAGIQSFEKAGYSKEDINEDHSRVMADKAEKLDAAMIRIKEILAEKGVPVFEKFVDTLSTHQGDIERFVDGIAKLTDWFMSNPLEGLGALMVANVVKDLTAAGIGVVVKDTLANILTKGAAGGNPMTFTGAVTMAAGVVTIMAAKQAVEETLTGQVGGQRRVGEISSMISHLNELPPEARRKNLESIQAELEGAKKNGGLAVNKFDPAALAIDSVATAITGDKKGVFGANEGVNKAAFSEELLRNMAKFNEQIAKANQQLGNGGATGGGATSMAHPNDPSRSQTHGAPRSAQ